MVKKHSIEEFVAKARDVHGDRYDYSLFDYVNCRTNGKIVCKKHGVFEQQPRCHVSLKHGCQFCGSGKLLLEEFISKAREIHGERYDYSLFDYVDSLTKSKITCQKHGVFEQMPDTHIRQKGGCYKCGRVVYDTEKFVSKAREFHGDKYDYSLFEYRHSHIKGKIICPIHGIFELTPSRHLHGSGRNKKKIPSGCQTCGSEKLISRLLRQHYGDISAVITHEESREWQEGGSASLLGSLTCLSWACEQPVELYANRDQERVSAAVDDPASTAPDDQYDRHVVQLPHTIPT